MILRAGSTLRSSGVIHPGAGNSNPVEGSSGFDAAAATILRHVPHHDADFERQGPRSEATEPAGRKRANRDRRLDGRRERGASRSVADGSPALPVVRVSSGRTDPRASARRAGEGGVGTDLHRGRLQRDAEPIRTDGDARLHVCRRHASGLAAQPAGPVHEALEFPVESEGKAGAIAIACAEAAVCRAERGGKGVEVKK